MDSSTRYVVVGQNGSPYSMKLRAVMRYRRLPFDWVLRTERNMGEFAAVKPLLMPMIRFPGEEEWRIDSTPIIEELEQRHPGGRSIIPDSPGRAFLAYLIEDFADEWLTKAMFHYRWAYDADIQYASLWIADDFFPDQKGDARAAAAQRFAQRQIERMPLVGCSPHNAPIIEATYTRSLDLLESHVGLHDHLFGSRPSIADFGLLGQLKNTGHRSDAPGDHARAGPTYRKLDAPARRCLRSGRRVVSRSRRTARGHARPAAPGGGNVSAVSGGQCGGDRERRREG